MERRAAGVVIRPPAAAERRACRMLLPAATGLGQKSQLHVAVADDGRVVGAAALGLDSRVETHRGWQVDLRVIVPSRGLGIGRARLVDGRVVGFTLGRVLPGGVCEVDANVLHPSVRLGWANLWLKMEAGRLLLDGGVHTLRYFSLRQHTDTARISRQVGGRLV